MIEFYQEVLTNTEALFGGIRSYLDWNYLGLTLEGHQSNTRVTLEEIAHNSPITAL
jgi:hypothetical protein